ncbi:MAG TPA: methyltransferase domain-containing protein [Micromonosporaceae bacterium]|jgi:SAM-dependent methyltransferase
MTAAPRNRRTYVLDTIASIVAGQDGPRRVRIRDGSACSAEFADDLAAAVRALGHDCARTDDGVAIGAGAAGEVSVFLRTPAARGRGDGEQDADIVVDYHDPTWPVIRHVTPALSHPDERLYLTETQAFFGVRANTWNAKFGDDAPAYERAVAEAGVAAGATVVDVGCGTGRALSALRRAAGPGGTVIGIDVTPEMLALAAQCDDARLVMADARRLPLAGASVDVIFAAGLIQHLPDPAAGLAELARITRSGGTMIIFHPSGRAALAERHGRTLREDEPLHEPVLDRLLSGAGWRLKRYDDAPYRFFALALRS